MPSFKKLALKATEILGKTSAETAETATEPKTIPPAVFKNGREVKILIDKKEDIKNYKKRHKVTKTKDIQNILFPKEKRYYFKEIFYPKEPKLISIN